MSQERTNTSSLTALFTDLLLVFLSFLIAYFEKTNLPGELASLGKLQEYGWIFLLYLILVIGALYLSGFYTFSRTQTVPEIILGVSKATGAAFIILILILFTLKEHSISRLFLGLLCLNNALLLIGVKIGAYKIRSRLASSGVNAINALVIGTEMPAKKLIRTLENHPDFGYRIVGCLDPDPERVGKNIAGIDVIGTTDQLEHLLANLTIDEVFVAMPVYKIRGLNKLMYLCEEVGVRFSLMADWLRPNIAKTVIRNFIDTPIITYTATPTAVGQLLIKAILDRIMALAGLVLFSPLFLALALLVKLSGPGPVLFRQRRAGLNGRGFTMLKFRTMVPEAESLRSQLEEKNEMDGPTFKIKNDPRVTPIGRFLRHTSLDELPQLINVLKGEMSVVGPRPPIPEEVAKYERWQRRRLSMKPGLTCYWQISGRNEVSFEDWMTLDLKYIDNWSLGLDLIIILKTIPVVLTGRGAS